MTVLLTGFEPFGGLEVNPSQLIVRKIAQRAYLRGQHGLVAEVLPTEFAAAGDRITELICELRPDTIICLGVAEGLDFISLERVALNIDDSDVPDNAGVSPSGQLIVPDGPVAYWSTLPLERMRQELKHLGIPVRFSSYAGTFVCNHVFYVARYNIEQLGESTRCGFIHIPLITEQIRSSKLPSLPLAVMVAAIECCLNVLQETQ
jgi:pyroglutamyl-peptidase